MTLIIGKLLGPAANGVYGLIVLSGSTVSLMIVGGLDSISLRRISQLLALEQSIGRSDVAKIIASVGFAAVLVSATAVVAYEAFGVRPFGESLGILSVFAFAIVLFSRSLTRLTSAMLRAYQRIIASQIVEVVTIPCLLLGGLLFMTPTGLSEIIYWTMIVSALTAVAGIVMILTAATLKTSPAEALSVRSMYVEGFPLGVAAFALGFVDWFALIIVAAMSGVFEAGLYRVAAQTALTIGVVATGLAGAFSADISAAHATNDRVRVEAVLRSAMRLSAVLALMIGIVVLIGGRYLLSFIGPEFAPAYALMNILSAGQLAALVVGIAGTALAMTGHSRVHMRITVRSALSLLILAPAGGYFAGAAGVAAAVAATQLWRGMSYVLATRSLLGIRLFNGSRDLPAD